MLRLVARIGRPHGLRGEVTVALHTDAPEQRLQPNAEFDTRPQRDQPLIVQAAREHSGTWLVAFVGVSDRDAAEQLRGLELFASAEIAAEPDAWYPEELIGLAVVTVDGRGLGEVVALHSGAQDLLAVQTPGKNLVLVPFVQQLVPDVDISGRRIVVAPPQGLFPDED